MTVYKAIAAVQSALAKQGIAKEHTNTQPGQNYKFRGIDDVYAALSPLLSEHGLCMLPRVLSRHCDERTSSRGNALFSVSVDVEYDLVASEDGSKHTIRVQGEAMDSGDKATNKAMSAAYKYAAFQTFCIPCEGEDADATTHEVAPKTPAHPTKPAVAPPASSGEHWRGKDGQGREYESTGQPLPKGWFSRLKEDKAKALAEIGGAGFWGFKSPGGDFEICKYLPQEPKQPEQQTFDPSDDTPF